jgi:hypothetical protein
VRIKANPEQYVGKEFIICGGLRLSDYYNFSYSNAHDSHYSLRLNEAGKDTTTIGTQVSLYLSKSVGVPIVDDLTHWEEGNRGSGGDRLKLARVRATLVPSIYVHDKQWDMMEVLDVQFVKEDWKSWKPWFLEGIRQAEQDRLAEQAKERKRLADAKRQANKERQAAAEAAKWRTWTDSTGTHKTEAKFGGMAFGKVKLIKRDGSTVQVPIEKLSDEDQQWIEKRKR